MAVRMPALGVILTVFAISQPPAASAKKATPHQWTTLAHQGRSGAEISASTPEPMK